MTKKFENEIKIGKNMAKCKCLLKKKTLHFAAL